MNISTISDTYVILNDLDQDNETTYTAGISEYSYDYVIRNGPLSDNFIENITLDNPHLLQNETLEEVKILNLVVQYQWQIISPMLILIGVVGNSLSFAVVWKMQFWRRTPLFLLAVLAVTDTVILLDGLLRYWIMYTFDIDVRLLSDASCKINLFVVYFSMQFSSWILVCMTVDRFMKTNFPFRYIRIVTVKRAYVVLTIVAIILIGVNLHFFFTNGIVDSECNDLKRKYLKFEEEIFVFVDFALLAVVPFLIMLFLNIFIYRALQEQLEFRRQSVMESRRSRHTQNRRQFSRKLTRMLLFVSIYFLVSTVPISVYFIYDSYVKFDDDLKNARKDLVWTITYLFQYSNYTLNFIWYAAHNKIFRNKMKELIGFKPKGFRYNNTTRRFNKRSSTVSHMTTSLDSTLNETGTETNADNSEYSEEGSSYDRVNTNGTSMDTLQENNMEHI